MTNDSKNIEEDPDYQDWLRLGRDIDQLGRDIDNALLARQAYKRCLHEINAWVAYGDYLSNTSKK